MASFNDSSLENIVTLVGELSREMSLGIHSRHQLAITLIQNTWEAKNREIEEKNQQIEELKKEKIDMKQEIEEQGGIIASLTSLLHGSCQNNRPQNLADVDSDKV